MSKLQKAYDNLIDEYYWLQKSVSKQGIWDDELEKIDKSLKNLEQAIKEIEKS